MFPGFVNEEVIADLSKINLSKKMGVVRQNIES